MLVIIRTILGIICLVLCVLDIAFLIKIRKTMKMETSTDNTLLKDSLTYKELIKSLKLFGAIAILAFVVIILSWF
ncbi:hypothetical protein [uncultured Eubacterium sp.]|uniref:hypothetical protein n=1 Tax=uncultured Eubacterium sp. TaxID=165185 RepID=UPI0025942A8C|nr:hypothetical protein [uncultured Eubacterium sp.]